MTAFVRYQNEKEIDLDSLLTNTWTVIDLETFLNDTAAVGVILRGTGGFSYRWRTVGDVSPGSTGGGASYSTGAVSFGGSGNSIELAIGWIEAGDPPFDKPRIFVTGELHEDGIVVYDAVVSLATIEAQFASWVLRQPAPIGDDSLSDIASVIIGLNSTNFSAEANVGGVRERGSSTLPFHISGFGGFNWFVIGVDVDGFYETYSTGKAGGDAEDINIWEIGYVLKTSDVITISDPEAENLPVQSGTYGILDLSNSVPVNTFIVGGLWKTDFEGETDLFFREINSTDPVEGQGIIGGNQGPLSSTSQTVVLNNNLQAEYTLEDPLTDFYIYWYLGGITKTSFVLDTGVGVGDTAVVTLG